MNARFKFLGNELRESRRTPGATAFYKRESRRVVRRVDAVAEDIAAIDHLHWTVAQDIDVSAWLAECEVCGSDITFYSCECSDGAVTTPPLRAPLAEIARAA